MAIRRRERRLRDDRVVAAVADLTVESGVEAVNVVRDHVPERVGPRVVVTVNGCRADGRRLLARLGTSSRPRTVAAAMLRSGGRETGD